MKPLVFVFRSPRWKSLQELEALGYTIPVKPLWDATSGRYELDEEGSNGSSITSVWYVIDPQDALIVADAFDDEGYESEAASIRRSVLGDRPEGTGPSS